VRACTEETGGAGLAGSTTSTCSQAAFCGYPSRIMGPLWLLVTVCTLLLPVPCSSAQSLLLRVLPVQHQLLLFIVPCKPALLLSTVLCKRALFLFTVLCKLVQLLFTAPCKLAAAMLQAMLLGALRLTRDTHLLPGHLDMQHLLMLTMAPLTRATALPQLLSQLVTAPQQTSLPGTWPRRYAMFEPAECKGIRLSASADIATVSDVCRQQCQPRHQRPLPPEQPPRQHAQLAFPLSLPPSLHPQHQCQELTVMMTMGQAVLASQLPSARGG
jgi:hypothetical protein